MRRASRTAALAAIGATLLLSLWLIRSAVFGDDDEIAMVKTGTLVLGVEVSGTLKAVESSQIGPPVVQHLHRFKISMMAPEGEAVTKGQPIVAFDTSELQDRLRRHRNEVAEAETKVKKEEVTLAVQTSDDTLAMAEAEARLRKARMANAGPSDLFASIERDKASLDLTMAELEVERLTRRIAFSQEATEARIDALRADLSKARSEVDRIDHAIRSMTRTASRDGVVTYKLNWQNEKKKVGDNCWRHETVVEIPDLASMMANGEVEEALSGRISEGQGVDLHLDAHQDEIYRGTVTRVERAVQEKSWRNPLKIVHVEIALETTDPDRMRPGMRFKGTIEVAKKSDVLLIPVSSVFPSPNGPVARIRTFRGSRLVPLQLGESDGDTIEVLAGLESGDRVLVARAPA